jgi:aspartokinase-like uncharacterized kinase
MSGLKADARVTVDVVVKVGGALLELDGALDDACETLAHRAQHERLVIVPGGGPFANAVRALDQVLELDTSAAHWMAVLGMDQYAHLLASMLPGAVLVHDPPSIGSALDALRIPVLAPYRWLRETDPLPHSWMVTSDSIAAWIAGAIGAPRLDLIKAVSGPVDRLTDSYFATALPQDVECRIVGATALD